MEKNGTTTAPAAETDAPAERGAAALPDPIRPSAPAPPDPLTPVPPYSTAPSSPDPVALAQLWADQFQHLTTSRGETPGRRARLMRHVALAAIEMGGGALMTLVWRGGAMGGS